MWTAEERRRITISAQCCGYWTSSTAECEAVWLGVGEEWLRRDSQRTWSWMTGTRKDARLMQPQHGVLFYHWHILTKKAYVRGSKPEIAFKIGSITNGQNHCWCFGVYPCQRFSNCNAYTNARRNSQKYKFCFCRSRGGTGILFLKCSQLMRVCILGCFQLFSIMNDVAVKFCP